MSFLFQICMVKCSVFVFLLQNMYLNSDIVKCYQKLKDKRLRVLYGAFISYTHWMVYSRIEYLSLRDDCVPICWQNIVIFV